MSAPNVAGGGDDQHQQHKNTSDTGVQTQAPPQPDFVDLEQNRDVEKEILAEHAPTLTSTTVGHPLSKPLSGPSSPPPLPVYHKLSIHILSVLIPASIFGTLGRLGLDALMGYDGHPVFPVIYAQSLGSFVIGVMIGIREQVARFHEPLYIAVATGFCGSLTTFSTWQIDVFLAWWGFGAVDRGPFYNFLNGFALTVWTLCVSLASLVFGQHLSQFIKPRLSSLQHHRPPKAVVHGITLLSILSYGATLLTYFLLPKAYRAQATAALLFAFPGTLTRYLLSISLNPLTRSVPLGTLAANALATLLTGVFFVLRNLHHTGGGGAVSPTACSILQGLTNGYCGCLSTISTFVLEVQTLKRGRGAVYALLSWGVGQLLLLVVVGPGVWVGKVGAEQSCTFVS